MGTGISFPGVKRPGREADHSPPTSAEVMKKNEELSRNFLGRAEKCYTNLAE
jgi:hypothetical protein